MGQKIECKYPLAQCCACIFLLGLIAMLSCSFAWSIIARKQVKLLAEGYSSLVSNWDADMVFDILPNPNPVLTSNDFYVTTWEGRWPGNVVGCFCPKDNSRLKVRKGLYEDACNRN